MLTSTIANILALTLSGLAHQPFNSVIVLIIGRLIGGYSVANMCLATVIYLSEISTIKMRGVICPLVIPLGALGSIICAGLQLKPVFGNEKQWEIPTYLGIVFPMLYLIFYRWIPESPARLHMMGEVEKTEEVIKKLYGTDKNIENCGLDLVNVKDDSKPASWKEIFSNITLRKVFIYIIILNALDTLVAVTSLSMYTKGIIDSFKFTDLASQLLAIAVQFFRMAGQICGSYFSKKWSRRNQLMWSWLLTGIMTVALTVLDQTDTSESGSTILKIFQLLCITIAFFTFGLGVHALAPFSIPMEILPVRYKPAGQLVGNMTMWFGIMTVTFVFPIMNDEIGSWSYLILGSFNFVGLIYTYFRVIESKGRNSLTNFLEFEKRGYF